MTDRTFTDGQGGTTTDPETGHVPIPVESPREWALGAARMDASLLISPRARERAIGILAMEPLTPETRAAMLILGDGGAQQGTEGYQFAPSLRAWRDAADTLGVKFFPNDNLDAIEGDE